MKLKKIASLALAGIMAVSMLAGCNGSSSSSSEPTTPPETVTGVAATINANLDDKKDVVSFTNDDAVQNLLKTYFSNNHLSLTDANAAENTTTVAYAGTLNATLANQIKTTLGIDYIDFDGADGMQRGVNTSEKSYVEVYVLSGKLLTEENALKQVAEYIDNLTLPKDNGNDKDYSYSGTAAAIKAETEGKTKSAWVIAVTITQTPSAK